MNQQTNKQTRSFLLKSINHTVPKQTQELLTLETNLLDRILYDQIFKH